MGSTTTRRRLASLLMCCASVSVAACGSGGDRPETISRDVFVDTYVDLRTSALDTEEQRVDSVMRARILEEHGVTAQDLTHFADVHGAELEFMRDVWNDIEARLDRTPAQN